MVRVKNEKKKWPRTKLKTKNKCEGKGKDGVESECVKEGKDEGGG
jgi:hypothetical protein